MNMKWKNAVKRLLDIQLSLAGLVILSPVLIFLAIALRTAMGRPVLFRQDVPEDWVSHSSCSSFAP